MDTCYIVSMEQVAPDALEQRRDGLIQRLHNLPNLMRGTVYERRRKCGRRSCECAQGGPKHLTRQLVVTLKGRTHTRYVRTGEMEKVQALAAAYDELWEIVNALTEVNLEGLRGEHPGGRFRRGRRRS